MESVEPEKSLFEKLRGRNGFFLLLSSFLFFIFGCFVFVFLAILGAIIGTEEANSFLSSVGLISTLIFGITSLFCFVVGLVMFIANKSAGELSKQLNNEARASAKDIPGLSQVISPDLSLDDRKRILQNEINKYVRNGFRVISQTDTTAQLVKPKSFSCLWFLIWAFLLIGWIFYLAWYMVKRDQQVYLEVDIKGRIKAR